MSEEKKVLVVGLGNPGAVYETTRHNVGQLIVSSFAKDQGSTFKSDAKIRGKVASARIRDVETYFLIPTTFMNNSGLAVQKAMQVFEIDIRSVLVVVDDIYTEFGRFRMREKGSPGGHNGLKSIEAHLLSEEVQRLKIGIGDRYIGSLEEYVLSDFTETELDQLPEVITNAKAVINFWIAGDTERARDFAGKASLNMQGET